MIKKCLSDDKNLLSAKKLFICKDVLLNLSSRFFWFQELIFAKWYLKITKDLLYLKV